MRILLVLLFSANAFASGFAEEDDFASTATPESNEDFIGGKLGILSESLWPRWRAVAFRVLAGPPIDATTRDALASGAAARTGEPVKEWLNARKIAPVPAPPKLPDAQYGYDYGNCYADAFATAVKTLGERAQKFGAQSKEVKEWLGAQDLVFSNCDNDAPIIPAEKVAAGIDPLVQKDRDYQVAAAWFYARKFSDARTAFERVAADASSPWAGYGRFVTARAMIRQAVAGESNDVALLGEAEKRLEGVLKDAKAGALRPSAERLLRFIAFRTRPGEQLQALGEMLAKGSGTDLGLVLTDFAWLADKQATPISLTDLDRVKKSELTEWALAWQLSEADRATRALERYREKKSAPWLILALASVPPDHPQAKALLEDARQIKAGSPGYLTAAYHRARLLGGQKRLPAARALLDEALGQKDLGRDAQNKLAESRYQLARTLEEAIAYMPRSTGRGMSLPPAVNDLFLQFLPIAESAKVAGDKRLPDEARRNIARAAFLRAALLDDVDLAKTIAPQLTALDTEAKALIDEWRSAESAERRRNAVVHGWLRSSWDLYLYGTASDCNTSPALLAKESKAAAPAFLDPKLAARARSESEKIDKIVGCPATFRANQMADWAAAHKDDPRVPEDLHLAVTGTKHSCDGANATAASKRAWKILHNSFPANEWTKKTKYWYP